MCKSRKAPDEFSSERNERDECHMKSLIEKLKPSHLTKAICLILATITFALSLWCVGAIGKGAMTYGKDAYLHGNTSSVAFTESDAFGNALSSSAAEGFVLFPLAFRRCADIIEQDCFYREEGDV